MIVLSAVTPLITIRPVMTGNPLPNDRFPSDDTALSAPVREYVPASRRIVFESPLPFDALMASIRHGTCPAAQRNSAASALDPNTSAMSTARSGRSVWKEGLAERETDLPGAGQDIRAPFELVVRRR